VRITGGIFRSRSLSAPKGERTRPTSDRVREALFDILTAHRSLDGARVLDLYAGTGALALEALSRGAAHATLVESARSALAAIDHNIDVLGLRACTRVVPVSVPRAVRAIAPGAPFDLVLADPPYAFVASGEAVRALSTLLQAGLVTEGSDIVLEHSSADAAPAILAMAPTETRRYGDTALSFYLYQR
jgi:16S rRNA (guanine966-N2)-methyltransferase